VVDTFLAFPDVAAEKAKVYDWIRKASLEALSIARRLAGEPVAAVLPGKGVAALAAGLGKYGAGVVYVADRDDLALYSTKGYVGALDAAAKKESPDAVLLAATSMGKDVAPRFAARHDSGVLADLMDVRVEDGGSSSCARLLRQGARGSGRGGAALQVATTRPNVFPAGGGRAEPRIETLEMRRSARARVVRVETSSRGADVSEADIIVSGGRGQGPENWPLIRDLQEASAPRSARRASWTRVGSITSTR
jgi:electron transfer flavoprotein alpha subunit